MSYNIDVAQIDIAKTYASVDAGRLVSELHFNRVPQDVEKGIENFLSYRILKLGSDEVGFL